ncbi:MAG: 50S ribosomal protein L13 [Patescibacteria group bacterium]|jgi:large subunit ribosomal protein L13
MQPKVVRVHQKIDATGIIAGRLASQVATMLIGKHKASFTPNMDVGDFVDVENVGKMVFSGKKTDSTFKHTHSGYQGGLKTASLKTLFAKDPAKLFKSMVSRMLPKNTHRTPRLKRLTVKK